MSAQSASRRMRSSAARASRSNRRSRPSARSAPVKRPVRSTWATISGAAATTAALSSDGSTAAVRSRVRSAASSGTGPIGNRPASVRAQAPRGGSGDPAAMNRCSAASPRTYSAAFTAGWARSRSARHMLPGARGSTSSAAGRCLAVVTCSSGVLPANQARHSGGGRVIPPVTSSRSRSRGRPSTSAAMSPASPRDMSAPKRSPTAASNHAFRGGSHLAGGAHASRSAGITGGTAAEGGLGSPSWVSRFSSTPDAPGLTAPSRPLPGCALTCRAPHLAPPRPAR